MDTEKGNIHARLSHCFSVVFPLLPTGQIPLATAQTVKEWDSIAAIMLVNTIEEEFGITIDYEILAELDSFHAIAGYLDKSLNGSQR